MERSGAGIDINIHLSPEDLGLRPRTKARQYRRTTVVKDRETWLTDPWWNRSMKRLFDRSFHVWQSLQAAQDASTAGASVESGGLDMDDVKFSEKTKEVFAIAHGIHIRSASIVKRMMQEAISISERRAIPKDALLAFIETRIDLFADRKGYNLNQQSIADLKALLFQGSVEI